MAALSAPVIAAALLLAVAGVAKLAAPDSTVTALRAARLPANRLLVEALGVIELVVGVAVVVWAPPAAVAVMALSYLAFAAFTWRLLRAQGASASCGCFGARTTPAHPLHVLVNLGVALWIAGALVWPVDGLGQAFGHTPLAGIPFVVATASICLGLYLALTALPEALDAAD